MRTIFSAGAAGFAALAALAAWTQVQASSESAWNTLDRTAHARCATAIKTLAPSARVFRSTGRVTGIGGEGDLYYALVFRGQESGKPARWLCLFDKREQKAQAAEITD
jgi:hypothetical protein